jgi:pilus assembly protein Flp/PilA
MKAMIGRLVKEEGGALFVEYMLLATLIAVACVVAVTALGATVSARYTDVSAAMP